MTSKDTILIADDDPSLLQVLSILLKEESFHVLQAQDGAECLRIAYERHPDLILLDVMMPNKDGREVCRQLREVSNVPIIMLTALSGEREKVERFQDGADDYVTKPFHNEELVARIRSVLRRSHHNLTFGTRVYNDQALQIDFESHHLTVDDVETELSPKEWRLLECLVKSAGRVVTRQTLLRYAWGGDYEAEYNYLKVFISHLRQKLGDTPKHPRYIQTVRDIGYRFESRE